MTVYWETGNYLITFAAVFWGFWVGWNLRGDCNHKTLLDIQARHIKEIFKARKARLCELLDIPTE